MENNTELDQLKIHMLSNFLLGIKTLGGNAIDEAISHLTEYKSLEPCAPGYTRDANGVCQKDPVPPDPTHQ